MPSLTPELPPIFTSESFQLKQFVERGLEQKGIIFTCEELGLPAAVKTQLYQGELTQEQFKHQGNLLSQQMWGLGPPVLF